MINPNNPVVDDEDVDENYDPEAEIGFEPKGDKVLQEAPLVTGEENDETVTKFRAKIYRNVEKEWKERGVGDLKFLKNKESGKVRITMRQDKTGKVIANHFVTPNLCRLLPNKTTEKAWIWSCYDSSDEEAALHKLCARFTSMEEYKRFEQEFENAKQNNAGVPPPKNEEQYQEQQEEVKKE